MEPSLGNRWVVTLTLTGTCWLAGPRRGHHLCRQSRNTPLPRKWLVSACAAIHPAALCCLGPGCLYGR